MCIKVQEKVSQGCFYVDFGISIKSIAAIKISTIRTMQMFSVNNECVMVLILFPEEY